MSDPTANQPQPDPLVGPDPGLGQSGIQEDVAALPSTAGDAEAGVFGPGMDPSITDPSATPSPSSGPSETTGSSTEQPEVPPQPEDPYADFHPLAQQDHGLLPDDGYEPQKPFGDASGGIAEYAFSKLADYGWGPQEMPALIGLWNETSSPYTQSHTGTAYWDPEAENILSRASGIPGLMPDTLEGLGYDPARWDDPQYQVDMGLEYIKGAYKTPTNAWNAMRLQNWY